MERFEIKEYDLRFIINYDRKMKHGVNVSLTKKPPLVKEDLYWIDSITHENIGFTYKVYGLDEYFSVFDLHPLSPVLVSKEALEIHDLFYHDGRIFECCRLFLDEETEKWIVMSEEEVEYFEDEVYKIIATPNMFGWVYNEGPPHDHNYNWVDSRFLEQFHDSYLIKSVLNGFKLSIVVEVECSNKVYNADDCIGELKIRPLLHENRIILDSYNLLRNSSSTIIY